MALRPHGNSLAAFGIFSLLLVNAMAACGESESVRAARAKSEVVTLFDMEAAIAQDRRVARTASFPNGFDPKNFLVPVMDEKLAVKPHPAFSEGQPAAFVTTEIWVNVAEVWAQPGYFLASAWNQNSPFSNVLRDSAGSRYGAIFDVGQDSAFYSPFWKFFFVEVPASTPPDQYKSTEQIFNEKLQMHEGPVGTYSLAPDNVTVASELSHPTFGTAIRTAALSRSPLNSWTNGEEVNFLLQGLSNFRVDENLVVEESPFFMLSVRGPNGAPQPLDVPPVIGSVPLFSGRTAGVAGAGATFGAYSRIYFAMVPATAAPFNAEEEPAAAQLLMTKGLDARSYRNRVALNGKPPVVMGMPSGTSCFKDPGFPEACVWLDSQKQIEARLGPANIQATEVTWASPIVDIGTPRAMQ